MPEWLIGQGFSVVGFVTVLITSGIVIQLIRVGPERRKIDAGTVTEGATAASLLTQQAMAMIAAERETAAVRVREAAEHANARVAEANVRVAVEVERRVAAEARADAEDAAHRVCEEEQLQYAREIGRLLRRLAQWEDWATEGKESPRRMDGDGYDGIHG